MVRVAILVMAVLAAACGGAPARPGVTEDPVLTSCRSAVTHANENVQDESALDLALGACGSIAMLEQALRDDPGYLGVGVDPRTFATTRCSSASALSSARICQELSAVVSPAPTKKPKATPKATKKPAGVGGGYYRPPGWNGSSDVDCSDFDTHAHAQSFFKGTGGSRTRDPYKLDPDHDGLACEGLR
jgi:hypothetical protein